MMSVIFAVFVNELIPGMILAALVWLLLRYVLHRNLNAATRYVIWWIAIAALIALPAFELLSLEGKPFRATPHTQDVASSRATPIVAQSGQPASVPDRTVAAPLQTPPVGSRSATSAPHVPATPRISGIPMRLAFGSWSDSAARLWTLLTGVMLLRLLVSAFVLARIKRRAVPVPGAIAARLDSWLAAGHATRRNVRVLVSGDVSTPMLAGPINPAILIPLPMLESLSEADLDQIGVHEAAHLGRRDDYTLLVQRFLEALLPLHPPVRWILRQIHLDREIACDDYVVQFTGQPTNYAGCLTRIAAIAIGVRPGLPGGTALAATAIHERSHLAQRVSVLLDRSRKAGTGLPRRSLTGAVVALALCALILSRAPHLIAMPQTPVGVAAQPGGEWYVPMSVLDVSGGVVTGLDASAFRLFEDGVEQTILRADDLGAISTGIVLDTNNTADPNLGQSRKAIEQLLAISSPEDEFLWRRVVHKLNSAGLPATPAKFAIGSRRSTHPHASRSLTQFPSP